MARKERWLRRLRDVTGGSSVIDVLRTERALRKLLSCDFYDGLKEQSPDITRQRLKSYLFRSMPLDRRYEATLTNYDFFRNSMRSSFYRTLLRNGLNLWINKDTEDYHVVLRHNREHFYEGDVLIVFYRQDVLLFQVSFSIIPGRIVGERDERVIFVGGAQGAAPGRNELQPAVRANGGVAPSHLAMAALQGVARALSIDTIVGVSNGEQLLKTKSDAPGFSFDYDGFWPMFGAASNERGHMVMAAPFTKPPTDTLSAAHRRRSKRKQSFKAEVRDGAWRALETCRATAALEDLRVSEEVRNGRADDRWSSGAPV